MINFKTIEYQNFLSVGSQPIKIDFNASRSTLVVGHNGAGKSLMLDALSFALFGKPHRAINKPQLVNSINGKKCVVTVDFSIGTKEYRIVRGIKPSVFEIWVDGEMINQESHSRDYQKLLETNILKLNHKSFHQVVVLGSSNFVPFMQLPAQQRRAVIEDLLDISIFSKMNHVLKETQAKLKDRLGEAEHELELVKTKVTMQNTHIDKLVKIGESNDAKYDEELREVEEQIDVYIQSNKELLEEYQEKYPVAKEKVDKINKTIASINDTDKGIGVNIETVDKDIRFYTDNSFCPTCDHRLSEGFREEKIEKSKKWRSKLVDGKNALQGHLTKAMDDLKESQEELNRILQLNHTLTTNQSLIAQFNKRADELKKQKNETSSDKDLDRAKTELEDLREARESLSNDKSELIEERHYNDVLSELLKDTGIKTKIIKQYLPVMNKLINNYLQVLDFFVSFELDENFNETIKARHRDAFSYSSFSEGEKQRVDLSLLFAWRQIAKMKNSANTNLLMLDEVFDASLDIDGIDNLLKIMNTLDAETRVFVISHKQDLLEGKFERKLEFERRQNFTQLKSVS